jgi:hypothetical protein
MAWYNSGADLGKSLTGVRSTLFGGKNDAGILGTGQFKGEEIPINEDAFTNTKRFDKIDKDFANEIAGIKGTRLDTMPQGQARQMQLDLANALRTQSQGGGPPSIAQQMLNNQTSQNILNAQSQAASMRGVNPAMALRMQQGQAANLNQQAANQGAMLRSQEILNAQQALGNISSGMRGQDIGLAEAQQQGALNRGQMVLQGLGQRGQLAGQATQGARDLEQLKVQQRLGMAGVNQKAQEAAGAQRGKILGGVAGGIMEALDISDRNLKTDIEPARTDPAVQEFLDALTSSTYRYKNPEHGEGRYLGPMAQDLERTELGRDMVMDTPEGKMVDYGRGAPAYLGVAGLLNDRLDDLEARMQSFLEKRKK